VTEDTCMVVWVNRVDLERSAVWSAITNSGHFRGGTPLSDPLAQAQVREVAVAAFASS